MEFPANLEQKAKMPPPPGGGGYPYQLSAKDLMDNYRFAALEVDDSTDGGIALKETVVDKKRKISLVIPSMPTTGTHVLGVVDGVLQWIETEECA
jgi:hypothetical protein